MNNEQTATAVEEQILNRPTATGRPDMNLRPKRIDLHDEVNKIVGAGSGNEIYQLDVETHQELLVHANSLEEAISKAVVNFKGDDPAVTEMARDVHVCAHEGNEHDDDIDDEDEGE